MAEYIDKELVTDTIEELKSKALPKALLFDHLKKVIEIFPTEDFAPVKHGHWRQVDENKCECSNCGIVALIGLYPHGDKNYCPNCGAKMDGGKSDE